MKNEHYFKIHGWMINRLHLKGAALLVYARIYSLTAVKKAYSGQIKEIPEDVPISRTQAFQVVRDLKKAGLLYADETGGLWAVIQSQNETIQSENRTIQSENRTKNNRVPTLLTKSLDKKDKREDSPPTPSHEHSVDDLALAYAEKCPQLRQIGTMTAERRQMAETLLRNYGWAEIVRTFETANASRFLTGHGPRGWVASFDWLASPGNFAKVADGNYTDEPKGRSYVPQYIYDQEAGQYDDERASEEELEEIRKHMNQED
jgi:hypothetical protein